MKQARMPFGKFKGQPMQELPDDYLNWLESIELYQPLRDQVRSEQQQRARRDAKQILDTAETLASNTKLSARDAVLLFVQAHPDHARNFPLEWLGTERFGPVQ